jgi:hypothetical protein
MTQKTALQQFINEMGRRLSIIENEPFGVTRDTMIDNLLLGNFEYLEMEKQQHGQTWDAAIKAHDDRGYVHARSLVDFDEYYEGTFNK